MELLHLVVCEESLQTREQMKFTSICVVYSYFHIDSAQGRSDVLWGPCAKLDGAPFVITLL